jgi:hypothetical protein
MILETIGERQREMQQRESSSSCTIILTSHPIGRPMWAPYTRESEGCLAGTRSQLPELPALVRMIEHQGDTAGVVAEG